MDAWQIAALMLWALLLAVLTVVGIVLLAT